MLGVAFQFTENCNFRCRHCASNCGPGGKTMPIDSVKRVIRHLPSNMTALTITGGEPLTRPELYEILEYIRDNRRFFPGAKIYLETNGYWGSDVETAYEILRKLYDCKVFDIRLSGMDYFHREQGLNTDSLNHRDGPFKQALSRMAEYLKVREAPFKIYRGGRNDGCVPVGRGRHLPPEDQDYISECHVFFNHLSSDTLLTIAADGQVYICQWRVLPSIGSALSSPIEDLLLKMKEHPLINLALTGGARAIALRLGLWQANDEMDYEYTLNSCNVCAKSFADFDSAEAKVA